MQYAVKEGRPGIKGRNGGYHSTSLSYINSQDKFKYFKVFLKLRRIYFMNIWELIFKMCVKLFPARFQINYFIHPVLRKL